MRKLASIQRIDDIQPIEGRDRIVLATVEGWHVIVTKDFNVGDKVIFCEIDSVLPEKPEFEFLRPKKFHIKTMKMAGVVSQGICFPLDILPEKYRDCEIGEDVTEVIGVTQYEPTMDKEPSDYAGYKQKHAKKYPQFLMRFAWFRKLVLPKPRKGGFPSFISKTDEERVQNMTWIVNDKREWVATEKVDGQSGTWALVRHKGLFRDKFEYIVCSRNLRLMHPDNSSYWRVSEKYQIENALKNMIGDREWIAIQGECIGPKIQKNKYKREDYEMYVFNLIYPSGRVDSVRAKSICENKGFNFVPIIDTKYILPDTVDEILAYADGQSVLADTMREGIVFRSADGKQSFKAVSNAFLLKWSE